ncbi:MAG: hypothetical protein ACC682_09270 [Gemmatimonadota bacterium]
MSRLRRSLRLARAASLLPVVAVAAATTPPVSAQELSFDRYRAEIEPIFYADRGGYGPGRSACVTCHVRSGTPLKLQPLHETEDGGVYWTEAESRRNFAVVARLISPGEPRQSRLLRKPLAVPAGGVSFHVGGKFFESRDDPEWRQMASWVEEARTLPGSIATAQAPELDFGFFRECVQRIFLDKRAGNVECIHCHGSGSRNFARAIPEEREYWDEEESRRNFSVLRRYIEPGEPLMSRFLTHPLNPDEGGDHYHSGGRRWDSQADPEWRMLAAWVRGEGPECLTY